MWEWFTALSQGYAISTMGIRKLFVHSLAQCSEENTELLHPNKTGHLQTDGSTLHKSLPFLTRTKVPRSLCSEEGRERSDCFILLIMSDLFLSPFLPSPLAPFSSLSVFVSPSLSCFLSTLGRDPRPSHMLANTSTTELSTQLFKFYI